MSRQISPIVCNAFSRFDSRSFFFGSFGLRGRALLAVAAFDAADFVIVAGRDFRFGAIMCGSLAAGRQRCVGRTDVSRYSANTIEDMQRLLLGYRDNMRVEGEHGIPVTAKTVADLRALPTWPDGLVLDIHVDLDPRLSVVRVERAS
jgi:hypothetical protein